jgi:hypothetical protein
MSNTKIKKTAKQEIIIGYKGFGVDFKCLDFQYKVGSKYHEDEASLCHSGFHFVTNPFDIFNYYPPATSRFGVIKALGVSSETSDDSKRVCTNIEIVREINLQELIDAGVDFITTNITKTNTNTGYQSAATNTGDQSAATNTGDQSAATNTGDQSAATNTGVRSAATVEGNDSVAIAIGYDSKAKGALGCAIVVVERGEWNGKTYPLLAIKSAMVDGKTIKANTFYKLVNKKFVEVE